MSDEEGKWIFKLNVWLFNHDCSGASEWVLKPEQSGGSNWSQS